MIVPSFLANRTVAVLGLGRSGLAVVEALDKGGARVLAWDDAEERREPLARLKIPATPIADWIWSEIAMLVLSPGIPLTHPRPHTAVQAARAAGVPVIGDIELLSRAQPRARYVGITGTNGKSTTTALTACLLQAAGETVAVGGNLGPAALSLAPLDHAGLYVLELSSYQLDLVDRMRFDVSALLNITPDHLERHGGMDGYIAVKERIFQGPGAAVIGVDDEITTALASRIDARAIRQLIRISGRKPLDRGVYVQEGRLIDAIDGSPRAVFDLNGLKALPGSHNGQNAAASYAICRALGVPVARVLAGFSRFPGLAHRQEHVGQIDKVVFINDSKATNADAAARALGCYETIYWIAGGVPKAGGIASLAGYFPRIRHAFLIGRAAESFAAALHGQAPVSRCDDLAKAVTAAFSAARADDLAQPVVLLSPACASFDQFADFEQRGDIFRRLVADLIAERAA